MTSKPLTAPPLAVALGALLATLRRGTHPAHPLAEYAGEYENPAYGTIEVETEGDALKARFHGIEMSLEHWHYEVFRALPTDPVLSEEKLLAQFLTNVKGDVDRV